MRIYKVVTETTIKEEAIELRNRLISEWGLQAYVESAGTANSGCKRITK